MTTSFENVQRIVLHGTPWLAARHLVLDFSRTKSPSSFLMALRGNHWPIGARPEKGKTPKLQVSLGFSRFGLERLQLPPQMLSCFFLKSPAFYAGAPVRASSELGATGNNAPERWARAFAFPTLHAVLSLHVGPGGDLANEAAAIREIADQNHVRIKELPPACKLPTPAELLDEQDSQEDAQYVHFGYRDGLSRVGIKHWRNEEQRGNYFPISMHEAGEFLLGHKQDCGANPWLASPQGEVWLQQLRDFFRDGSFGVLHQVQQDVPAFEAFVNAQTAKLKIKPELFKAKLCGRFPNGQSLATDDKSVPGPDFDYRDDADGLRCPFGSHTRRMNPRDPSLVEAGRTRALLRRGMPYGEPGAKDVGLIAHFFCASIEDQFEHLVGQWADRVPLGSQDGGGARDPLAGAHQPGDGVFQIPRKGKSPLKVHGLSAFTRTRGTAYLFYPSLTALDKIMEIGLAGSRVAKPIASPAA
jgi:deferrochelatase/peroxidase EfeB